MEQKDFIWVSNNIGVEKVVQKSDEVIVTLMEGVTVTHNYKSKPPLRITFTNEVTESGTGDLSYAISKLKDLEFIYQAYNHYKFELPALDGTFRSSIHDFCDKKLQPLTSSDDVLRISYQMNGNIKGEKK